MGRRVPPRPLSIAAPRPRVGIQPRRQVGRHHECEQYHLHSCRTHLIRLRGYGILLKGLPPTSQKEDAPQWN